MSTGMPVESPVRGDLHAGLYVTPVPMLTAARWLRLLGCKVSVRDGGPFNIIRSEPVEERECRV